MPYEYLCDCLKSTFRIASDVRSDTDARWVGEGRLLYEDYSDIMTEATEVKKIARETMDKYCIGWKDEVWG
tara:strand:+ start:129 stop:341 length:213 start_codon:yes stop_codon:yes gene_type:complete